MPRVDLITGCQVMTQAEFWSAEAEREGKGREPWELQTELFDELDREIEAQENSIKSNPVELLRVLNDLAASWNDGIDEEDRDIFVPGCFIGVEEVESVRIEGGFRSSGMEIIARVKMSDGNIRKILAKENTTAGSFYEPPDYDILIQELDKKE